MKTLYFVTPSIISYLDLVSMGGSNKADDDSTLGKYNSGLKFSMALALQNNIKIIIRTYDREFSENHDRKRETSYFVGTYTESCEQTEKEKELIKITKSVFAENFHSGVCDDYGGGEYPEEYLKTGFSTKLGVEWSLWMLLREIYSNMVDENGYYSEELPEINYGTVFSLRFEEDSEFAEIWNNRHLYINEKEPLFKISNSLDILENEEKYLRIYKQNILVYEDKEIPSRYAFNIKFGDIDERRILSNVWSIEQEIASQIMSTDESDFLEEIITPDFKTEEKEFLSNINPYRNASELINSIVHQVYEKNEEVRSYTWIIDSIKQRKDCKIAGKKIKSIGDSIWCYSNTVTVESIPEPFAEPDIEVEGEVLITPFSAEIKKHYNFNLDVEITKAKLKGNKCIADKYNNCLIIDENFDVETDFPEFIVQYIDLTEKSNVVKALSEYICKLLKK